MSPSALRDDIATACRIAAYRGLCEDILGHISVRAGDGLLMRCRGPRESGLLFTNAEDVREVAFDGTTDGAEQGYTAPNELHIHTEILRARPDVTAVLHVHPASIVGLDLAGLELAPIVGAYNIPASRMAREGVPVYPRSILVNTPALGRELADALGDKSSCVMRGHGLVTTGSTVQEALSRALSLDALARITLLAASAGEIPATLPSEDLEQLPDLGSAFNDANIWRCQVASLTAAGYALR